MNKKELWAAGRMIPRSALPYGQSMVPSTPPSDKIDILRVLVSRWKPRKSQIQNCEFYSGRMMVYSYMDNVGMNAERLYDIDEAVLEKDSIETIVDFLSK